MTYTPAFDEAAAEDHSPGIVRPSGGAVNESGDAVRPSGGAVRPDVGSRGARVGRHGSSKNGARRTLARPTSLERGPLDLRNTWQIALGSLLIPLGVIFILLAWYGAAHARVVQQQIPYLISGAFIGLGCMVVGGLLYWAHWLYRIYDQAELLHTEQLQAIRELLVALSDESGVAVRSSDDASPSAFPATSSSPTPSSFPASSSSLAPHQLDVTADAPASASLSAMTPGERRESNASERSGLVAPAEPPVELAARAERGAQPSGIRPTAASRRGVEPTQLVATATGSVYHLADCPIVLSHGEGLHQLDPQEAASLHPCRLCSPDTALD